MEDNNKQTTKEERKNVNIPKFNPDRPKEEYDFDHIFIELYLHEPFLGMISSQIARVEDWNVPTAYLSFDPKSVSFIMGYNPEFFASLNKEEKKYIIKHELYHMVLGHVFSRGITNKKQRFPFNVAADLAVNSILGEEGKPELALYPGVDPKSDYGQFNNLIKKFPLLQTMEYYFESIKTFIKDNNKCPECEKEKQNKQDKKNKKNKDKNQDAKEDGDGDKEEGKNPGKKPGKSTPGKDDEKHDHGDGEEEGEGDGDGEDGHGHGQGQLCEEHGGDGDDFEYELTMGDDGESLTLDSHDGWDELPEDLKDIAEQKLNEMMQEGVKRSEMKGSWGSVPSSMQDKIRNLLHTEINWKSILRYFFGKVRSMERESTIKKLNKKAPYLFPGYKRKTKVKFAFFIDQSGSMSNEDVQLAMSAAFECSQEVEIDVYNFDTEVDESSHQVWKKGNHCEWNRTRCGGTDFHGVKEFIQRPENRSKWTGIAIVTDGYAAKLEDKINIKTVWLITPTGTVDYVIDGDLVLKMKSEKTVKTKGKS